MQLTRYRFSDVIETRANNFDLLRLVAALAVMFGHSFWIQPTSGHVEPLLDFMGIEYSGSLAVYTFFLISGMLISASYARQNSPLRFAALRIGRIYPAFFVCVLLSAYVVYPLSIHANLIDSLDNGYALRYLKQYALMFVPVDRSLPHAFDFNAVHYVINGSLWTLPVEMKCYGIVLLAGVTMAIRSRVGYLITCGLALAGLWWLVQNPSESQVFDGLARKANAYSFYPVAFFIFGMAIYAMRDKIRVTWPVAACLLASYVFLSDTILAAPMLYLALVYGVVWLSATKSLHRFKPAADLSYGAYLWAFPIQQMVAAAYPEMDNILGLLISVPLTLLVAALSWFLVEKPVISLTRRALRSRDKIVWVKTPLQALHAWRAQRLELCIGKPKNQAGLDT